MKKILSIAVLFVIIATMCVTVVNATTSSELADTLYEMGKPYGLTTADKVKIERYVSDYNVTDEEADAVVAKAEEAVKVFEDAGVTKFSELSAEEVSELKTIANEAADILGIKLTFEGKSVKMYKDGKLIETVTNNNGKLSYTGNSTNTVLVVSSIAAVAVVALAVAFVARKKFANA